jgi:nucleoside-diphosphate-sugar epimerase
MRVLVTGAAGMIGRAVLDLLAAEQIPATALALPLAGLQPGDLPAERVVLGDARDVDVVTRALDGVDAVIHLAAIPTPLADPPEVVFGTNTLATFTVLDLAGRAGVRRASIASSYSVCGLVFASRPLTMPYLPIDVHLPLQITDGYALSKHTDELTAAMMTMRYGMDVVALRLPFVGTPAERLPARAEQLAEDPGTGAADVWSYLDVRDAARAMLAGLSPARRPSPSTHVLYVAAPETLSGYPTDWLVERYHPGVPYRPVPGRTVPIDLAPAVEVLGFRALHPWPVPPRQP